MAGGLWAVLWDGPLAGETRRALLARLSPGDRARFQTIAARREERGRQFLLSRALLAFALGPAPVLEKAPGGQPYLPARPGTFVSLSHTEGAALLALSDAPVGVDAERLRPLPPRLAQRFPGPPEDFWRRWTAAEAAAKREGRGLEALLAAARRGMLPPGPDAARSLPLGPGFAAALCGAEDLPLRLVTPEDLAE